MAILLAIALRLVFVVLSAIVAAVAFTLVPGWVASWLVQRGIEFGRAFQETGSLLTDLLVEVLRDASNGLLMLAPAGATLLLRTYLPNGVKEWLGSLYSALKRAWNDVKEYVLRGEDWHKVPLAFLKLGLYTAAAAFLLGWYGEVVSQTSPPAPVVRPAYAVSAADPDALLPVHLLVHFDNAAIDQDGEFTGRGVSVDNARREELRTTVETLGSCVAPGHEVTIQPYGFASDDGFRGLQHERSNQLNVEAANRRATVVHEALAMFADRVFGVAVEAPRKWKDLPTMIQARDSMVPVAEGNDRNAFADRVVILFVSDSGVCRMCRIQQSATAQPSENTAASSVG